ncbi:related to Zn-dependent alcohol dehydrogenases [Phialocephala subalpina]|uniref:Related to Zn-dependent alcohol dehydrogenases n=1 Tax=Phialocephala subalpina TaxID=576137 RepID=A0A1L7XUE8_9HELO|nr:related to Zn-dependent alcohol dehydrogenases [Phialocephala subalpina]
MKAYQWEDAATGLQLRDVPIPTPQAGEVLLRVEAAGLCHTDCHIIGGHVDDWVRKRPITLGHEVAGIINKVGSEVTRFAVGDRVAVSLPGHSTEEPDWDNAVGMGFDGGYAEYMTVATRYVVPIPDNVSFEQAAVAGDSILTAYHAVVHEAEVDSSKTVAVIGLGGVGLNGVRVAALQGGTVYGIDIDERKFDGALKQGAKACFSSFDQVPHVKFDAILDFAGVGTTTAAAVRAVKAGGRVILVGMGVPTMELSILAIVTRRIQIRGSLGASIPEFSQVLELISKGQIDPVLEEIPFTDVVEGLKRVERSEVNGRLFTRPNK